MRLVPETVAVIVVELELSLFTLAALRAKDILLAVEVVVVPVVPVVPVVALLPAVPGPQPARTPNVAASRNENQNLEI